MASSRNPMLAKCLENFPNSNQSNSVKSEFNFNDLFNSSNFIASFNHTNHSNHNHNRPFLNNSQTTYQASVSSMNSHLPNTSSFFQNDHLFSTSSISNHLNNDKTKLNNLNIQLTNSKSHSPKSSDEFQEPIDCSSIKGKFGWSTCKDLPLPYILRKDEKLVPVRVVEHQIIRRYNKDLPSKFISCISIKSFYITDNESKLLNEINSFHCDHTYGSERFSQRDVVVKLDDVINIDNFLETSKKILFNGLKNCDFLGFVQISGLSTVIPYIVKETSSLNSDQPKSSSSIASPLSNLSIKRTDSKERLPLNMQLEDLKYDLDGILNEEHISNDKPTFHDNSLTDLEDQNLNSNFSSNNLDNQLESIIYELDNDLNDIESRTATSTLTNYQQTHQASPQESSVIKRRFVPVQLVDSLLEFNDKVEKIDLNEWDCSYLKMICFHAGYDKLAEKLKASSKSTSSNEHLTSTDDDLKLICLDDLKWDQNSTPIVIKECDLNPSSDLPSANQYAQFNPLNHNQTTFNNYQTTPSVQPCFNFASNDNLNNLNNLNKKQPYLSNHHNNYFNAQQPSLNYTSPSSTSSLTPECFNFRTNLDNLNKKSPSITHNFYNQAPQSQSSIQMHHKKSTLTKDSNLDDLFKTKSTSLSFNNLNNLSNLNSNLNTGYTTKTPINHTTASKQDQYPIANTNNFTNCNKNFSLPILNSSGLNDIQNTSNSNILNELSKCFPPSNGLNNSTSLNNSIIGSNLNYDLNNRNSNLSMINSLNFPTYQPSNDPNRIKISNVTIDSKLFKSAKLKPYLNVDAVLLSEVAKQLFNGFDLSGLKLMLENSFDLTLYDCTISHEQAFLAFGLVVDRNDKLILVDDLRNNLHQIKNEVKRVNEGVREFWNV